MLFTGFEMTELLKGYHYMPAITNKRMDMAVHVKWGTEDLDGFLNPNSKKFLMCQMAGTLEVEGVVEKTRTFGYLHLNYPDNRIQYALQFKSAEKPPANDYLLIGEKMNIRWWNLPFSHTTCYTTITNGADQVISRGVLLFDFSNLWSFLRSLRIYK